MSWRVRSGHWSRHSRLAGQGLEVVRVSSGQVLVLLSHAQQVEGGVRADVFLSIRD